MFFLIKNWSSHGNLVFGKPFTYGFLLGENLSRDVYASHSSPKHAVQRNKKSRRSGSRGNGLWGEAPAPISFHLWNSAPLGSSRLQGNALTRDTPSSLVSLVKRSFSKWRLRRRTRRSVFDGCLSSYFSWKCIFLEHCLKTTWKTILILEEQTFRSIWL